MVMKCSLCFCFLEQIVEHWHSFLLKCLGRTHKCLIEYMEKTLQGVMVPSFVNLLIVDCFFNSYRHIQIISFSWCFLLVDLFFQGIGLLHKVIKFVGTELTLVCMYFPLMTIGYVVMSHLLSLISNLCPVFVFFPQLAGLCQLHSSWWLILYPFLSMLHILIALNFPPSIAPSASQKF